MITSPTIPLEPATVTVGAWLLATVIATAEEVVLSPLLSVATAVTLWLPATAV